jgi:hypothetical protein
MRYLLLVPFLSGCALFGQNPNLSPEQLKAISADNKNSAVCMSYVTAAGVGKAVVVNIDETRNIDGSVTVDADCKMTVNTATKLPPQKEPKP